jgi:hypothetical protein
LRARTTQRHFGLDWLRIGALTLLILYHIGLIFSPWHWLVKSAHRIDGLAWLLLTIDPWRLELLFVVSGYASHALLGKLGTVRRFARMRTGRLLAPLAFGVMLVNAPQDWVRLRVADGYSQSFWHFWTHDYFRFAPIHGIPLPNWEHLWFVGYLWLYTMLLCGALVLLRPAVRARIGTSFDQLAEGQRLLWLPLGLFIVMRLALLFVVPESDRLLTDWIGHAMFLPGFLFGFALAGTDKLWPALARLWRLALVIAAIGYLIMLVVEIRYPGNAVPPHAIMALARAGRMATMWGIVLILLHLAHTRLNHDHPLRAWLSEAIFPFYIIHQTAIVLLGWWLLGRSWSAPAEFALLIAGTLTACSLFYAVAAQSRWTRPLAGLAPRRRRAFATLTPLPEGA